MREMINVQLSLSEVRGAATATVQPLAFVCSSPFILSVATAMVGSWYICAYVGCRDSTHTPCQAAMS